ncbi:TPA: hypothetical protein SUB30_005562 [Bacillus pseudomycoides]|nr:hypothetical protein [Bacillus pseudomycoides]
MNQQTQSNNQNTSNDEAEEVKLADSLKLALLAGLFSLVGDVLGIYAAKLAIDETIQEQISQQKTNKEQEEQMQLLQKQIKELQKQIEILNKR